ncbi:SpaA isopeptide-forming pilin-related protein [Paucilactobacillus kaifaensis]|uniref:SpaA isopeptide-forming pilin-related protein n=1 Tax=Paucilactobacillus kaifaensis TaxID=2559921 RepID=UPI0010F6ADEE|nr:SpaA isopeptide-forming pilin-related protein [Paucilactobacillus kaifaensis]
MQIKKLWKRVGTLAAAAMLMAPLGGSLTSGSQNNAKAADNDVSIKVHKMMSNDTDVNKINNTGDELDASDLNGNTPYDPSMYGNAEFTLYRVDDWFDDEYSSSAEFTDAQEEYINAMTKENPANAQSAVEHQNDYLDRQVVQGNITKMETQTTKSDGTLDWSSVTNNGYYLIVESSVSASVDAISVPMMFRLPMADKAAGSTIHLYAKNQILDLDNEESITVKKMGVNPDDPTGSINGVEDLIDLANVTFKLERQTGDGWTTVSDNFITGPDGNFSLKGLLPGNTYRLTENVNPHNAYEDKQVSVQFKLDSKGIITSFKADSDSESDAAYTNTSGKQQITILNRLKLGEIPFSKVNENSTGISGAEFKLQHPEDDTKYAQLDKDDDGSTYKFIGWTYKDSATTIEGGEFSITGLPHDKYKLEETKAPDGYTKLSKPIEFTIDGSTEELHEIMNEKYDLPITGGMGILLFILAGLALMGTSYYLYRRNQKIKSSK